MEILLPAVDLSVIAPQLVIVVTGLAAMIASFLIVEERQYLIAYLSLLGVVIGFVVVLAFWGGPQVSFQGMALADDYATFFHLVFLTIAALTILISIKYLPRAGIERGEYYILILFATVGMMLMASAGDLIVIFLGLEILSISLYILAGLAPRRPPSHESALKYFLLGAFTSAFLLYGVALTYGATGTTNLARIAAFLAGTQPERDPMAFIGLGLLLVAFGFKVAMVPFHMWVPDVYEGAPSSVTAFMSVGAKAAGFAAFLRVLLGAFPAMGAQWSLTLAILSALTMTVGNVIAMVQTSVKRLLAYSGIAHAGYVLIGLAVADEWGAAAALFYLFAYTFTNLGAFMIVITQERRGWEYLKLTDYAGLIRRQPVLAAAMTFFLLSLAGIPPTVGFVGKLFIFSAAIRANLLWLAVIGVLNSVISVYVYVRVIVAMFMKEPEEVLPPVPLSFPSGLALAIAFTGTLIFGVFPAQVVDLAQQAVTIFGQ
ncbi:MAG: NADH-quinone oxidoreductase subunit N [Anaerolineae bacterium]